MCRLYHFILTGRLYVAVGIAIILSGSGAACAGFRFPAVPDSITSPGERAEYIIANFWELSEADAKTDFAVLETYFYALHRLPDSRQTIYTRRLLDSVFPDQSAYVQVAHFLDMHLGNPDSPLWNDRLYADAQNHIIASSLPDEYKTAPLRRIELLARNSIGDRPADLLLTDTTCTAYHLHDLPVPMILIFADSDCSRCHNELSDFAKSADHLRELGWNAFTIYIDGKIPPSAADYPVPLADTEGYVLDHDLYLVRRLPAVYIIDNSGLIAARELSIQNTVKYLLIPKTNNQ